MTQYQPTLHIVLYALLGLAAASFLSGCSDDEDRPPVKAPATSEIEQPDLDDAVPPEYGEDEEDYDDESDAGAAPYEIEEDLEDTAGAFVPEPEPDPEPAYTEPAPVPAPQFSIRFDVNSSLFSADARRVLEEVVGSVDEFQPAQIVLEGYTDQSGSVEYNQWLAQRRVDAVADFLVKQGVEATTLDKVVGGISDPTMAPAGEDPASWGRRVEIRFD